MARHYVFEVPNAQIPAKAPITVMSAWRKSLQDVIESGAQQILDHADGLHWRFRLSLLKELNKVLSNEDIAWAASHNGVVREQRRRYDYVETVRKYLGGARQLSDQQLQGVKKYLVAQMQLPPSDPILGAIRLGPKTRLVRSGADVTVEFDSADNLYEFFAERGFGRLALPRLVPRPMDVEPLDAAGRVKSDQRRERLSASLSEFLSTEPDTRPPKKKKSATTDGHQSQTKKYSYSRRPVFMIYGEHTRAMGLFVRDELDAYRLRDPAYRRVLAIDCQGLSGTELAEKIIGQKELDRSPEELAGVVLKALQKDPAIIVFKNFEPVLAGLDDAAIRAAARNFGLYDMFSRLVHHASNENRFIVLVSQALTDIDASYLYDVRLFTGLQPDTIDLNSQFEDIASHDPMLEVDGFRDPTLVKAIGCSQRYPGDVLAKLLAVANKLDNDELPAKWIVRAVNSNALEMAARRVFENSRFSNGQRKVLAAIALAEDRVELETLCEVLLKRVRSDDALSGQKKPGAGRSMQSSDVSDIAYRLAAEFKPLITEKEICEPDLHGEGHRVAFDMSAIFRQALLRVLESPRVDSDTRLWSRRVRRAISAIAFEQSETIESNVLATTEPDGSIDQVPSSIRRKLLSVLLLLASIDPDDGDEGDLEKAYAQIRQIEFSLIDGLLSQSHVYCQLKLQLWLCFQHLGFAGYSINVRYRERSGPLSLPLHPIGKLSPKKNLTIFTSLASGAFGAHELDYCDVVLSAANEYVAKHSEIADIRTNPELMRLWKIQCDLLVRRGRLADAEKYVRDRMVETEYYDEFDLAASVVDVHESLVRTEAEDLESSDEGVGRTSYYGVWSRLLARLGSVLRLQGAVRTDEAIECFEIASLFDNMTARQRAVARRDSVGDKSGSRDPFSKNPGVNGKPARAYLRCLASKARSCAADNPELSSHREKIDVLNRELGNHIEKDEAKVPSILVSVDRCIDIAIVKLANIDSSDPALLMQWANESERRFSRLSARSQGKRLHGAEACRLSVGRSVLFAEVMSKLNDDRAIQGVLKLRRVLLRKMLEQINEDARKIEASVSRVAENYNTPWSHAIDPMASLDGELARCFATAFYKSNRELLGFRQAHYERISVDELKSAVARIKRGMHRYSYFLRAPLLRSTEKLLGVKVATT